MSQNILIDLEMPEDLEKFKLPKAVDEQFQSLLDKQDRSEDLTPAECVETVGLAKFAELLSSLRLRAQRALQLASQLRTIE